jgi:predicted RNase H-like HicB family nuclease
MSKRLKIVVEKNQDGYIAYPLGVKAVIVGEGETYEEALADVKSAIKFHIESFGIDSLAFEPDILEAFVAETMIEI